MATATVTHEQETKKAPLSLTPQAIAKVREIMATQDPLPAGLRIGVVGGGCSGFQYSMAFENQSGMMDETRSQALAGGRPSRFRSQSGVERGLFAPTSWANRAGSAARRERRRYRRCQPSATKNGKAASGAINAASGRSAKRTPLLASMAAVTPTASTTTTAAAIRNSASGVVIHGARAPSGVSASLPRRSRLEGCGNGSLAQADDLTADFADHGVTGTDAPIRTDRFMQALNAFGARQCGNQINRIHLRLLLSPSPRRRRNGRCPVWRAAPRPTS